MGCDCNKTPTNGNLIHFPVLDRVQLDLQAAWLSEVSEENRPHIKSVTEIIQRIQQTTPPPTRADWSRLKEHALKNLQFIQCPHCRKHAYYDVVRSIDVAAEFERGHLWHAMKITISKDVKKNGWMLVAGYYRILKPWFTRIRRRLLGTRTPRRPH